ncbi:Nucleosome assembly protein 1;2 [Linum perenne]
MKMIKVLMISLLLICACSWLDSNWLNETLSAEDRHDLVNALKNKLQNLAGQHSNSIEDLPPKARKRVEYLKEIQTQHDELEEKFFKERRALEAKYQKLYEPLYTERYEVVNGIKEVDGVSSEASEDQEADKRAEKGVRDFWLIAMKNNEVLAEEITERDEAALKFLRDIKHIRIEEPVGFKLEFYFDSNPYFKNSVLTKTYHVIEDDDDPVLERALGTEIDWCPGKCLTQKILKKKPRKGSKNTKPITKIEDCPSFFTFFNVPQIPEDEDELDEDAVEDLQDRMEQDYNIGTTIRNKIIAHAVAWYTGEAIEEGDVYGHHIDVDDDDDNNTEVHEDDTDREVEDEGKRSEQKL